MRKKLTPLFYLLHLTLYGLCIVFTSIDERYDYEEIREISIGSIQGVVIITVAHTDRNGKIRLISARKATPKERRTYYEYLAQST